MSLALYIYLCEVAADIGFLYCFGFFMSFVVLVIVGVITFATDDFSDCHSEERAERFRKTRNRIVKNAALVFSISAFLSVVLPGKKTMYAMAAAYYGEQAVKSETFQKLNGKAMQLLEIKIDDLLKEEKKD